MVRGTRVYFIGAGPGDPELITIKEEKFSTGPMLLFMLGALLIRTCLRESGQRYMIQQGWRLMK